jgi:hypothetical protein
VPAATQQVTAGNGGAGKFFPSVLIGADRYFGGGGAGGTNAASPLPSGYPAMGFGGTGGGAPTNLVGAGLAGNVNTGGGGSGGSFPSGPGGAGGSGVVYIMVPATSGTPANVASSYPGGSQAPLGNGYLYTFLTSGSITF